MGYHLRVKICGITSAIDARTAASLGADAIGLNFAPESPRCIDAQMAQTILRAIPPFCEAVGVFVNRPLKLIYQDLQSLGRMMTIQWHGQGREMADPFPFKLIAACPVRDQKSIDEIQKYLDLARQMGKLPSALLLDGHAPGQHGGTGQRAPWELLAKFKPGLPLILAGGLTPDNVEEAVRLVRPWGVDVASGVELNPGWKDLEKMRKFIQNARQAAYQAKSH